MVSNRFNKRLVFIESTHSCFSGLSMAQVCGQKIYHVFSVADMTSVYFFLQIKLHALLKGFLTTEGNVYVYRPIFLFNFTFTHGIQLPKYAM